jgi:RNA polymerase sigma-70 factor (ECF subfamily)
MPLIRLMLHQRVGPTRARQIRFRVFVRGLQPSLADADDVLQETFLTVSRKASSFEPGTNFVAWACGIARLKVLENFRQKKQTNVLSEAAIIALADEPPTSELTGLREEALSRCVEKLMPKSRELLWRRYSGRQDSDEMANGLGMTSTAVRVALSKAAQVGNNGGRNRISHLPEAAAVD